MTETRQKQPGHWLALQSPGSGSAWGCRIESVGVKLPAQRLTTRDLMSRTSHRTHIQLERLTGIHERHVAGPGENSYTLAAGEGDRVMLLALASGIEIGIAIFTVDSLVDRYGNPH
jgi:3-oxoacyl-[acyl-carrier-protein] synthase III